ncbi:hypothetical protein GCM10009000_073130 [Halobacterium noricense]
MAMIWYSITINDVEGLSARPDEARSMTEADPESAEIENTAAGETAEENESTEADDLPSLRITADYQFGAGAGSALFPRDEKLEIRRSSSGRPQQVHADGTRLVTYATDGRFTLGLAGGSRLANALDSPAGRVIVGDESEPFVRDGKNVFAKFVDEADGDIRAGDEVLVTHENGDLLAVGRAELDADAILDFTTGMAVKVRDGAGE